MSAQSLIAIAGVMLGMLLIAALLLRRGGVRRGNRMLAAALACMLCYLLALVVIGNHWPSSSWLRAALISLYLLSPPLLLGYVRTLIRPTYRLQPSDLVHLLPALAFLAGLYGFSENISAWDPDVTGRRWPPDFVSLFALAFYITQIIYYTLAMKEVLGHERRIESEFSDLENVTLSWLRLLVGLLLALSAIGLALSLLRMVPGIELWPRSLYSMSMLLLVYYLIAFKTMSQPAIFGESSLPADGEAPGSVAPQADQEAKYGTGRLAVEARDQYWKALQTFMEEDAPYLDNELRIADLADRLDFPRHHLSQVINECAGQSFFEYVNGYRIQYALKLLADQDRPVTTVAFDAGFNSESAFYRHFKKVTGKTPRQYRRQVIPGTASV